MQQLTCKMVWSFSFHSLLLSFRLFELKQSQNPLILRKSPGGKILKNSEKSVKMCGKLPKSVKKRRDDFALQFLFDFWRLLMCSRARFDNLSPRFEDSRRNVHQSAGAPPKAAAQVLVRPSLSELRSGKGMSA